MAQYKHTPGPWRFERFLSEAGLSEPVIMYGTDFLATVYHRNRCVADARLMAAAPELLEALMFCQSVIQSQGMFDLSERMAFDKAECAIKKATEGGERP